MRAQLRVAPGSGSGSGWRCPQPGAAVDGSRPGRRCAPPIPGPAARSQARPVPPVPSRPALRPALPVAAHPGCRRTRPFCPGEGWCRSPRRSRCRRPGQVHSPAERRQRRRSPALIGRPGQRLPALGGGRLRLLLLLLRGRRRCPAPSLRRDPNAAPSAELRAPPAAASAAPAPRAVVLPTPPALAAAASPAGGTGTGTGPPSLPAAPRRPRLPRGALPPPTRRPPKESGDAPCLPTSLQPVCLRRGTRSLSAGRLLGLRSGVGTVCEAQRSKLRFP